jgi:hypothetical protein
MSRVPRRRSFIRWSMTSAAAASVAAFAFAPAANASEPAAHGSPQIQ